jgi:hypothetical protein
MWPPHGSDDDSQRSLESGVGTRDSRVTAEWSVHGFAEPKKSSVEETHTLERH